MFRIPDRAIHPGNRAHRPQHRLDHHHGCDGIYCAFFCCPHCGSAAAVRFCNCDDGPERKMSPSSEKGSSPNRILDAVCHLMYHRSGRPANDSRCSSCNSFRRVHTTQAVVLKHRQPSSNSLFFCFCGLLLQFGFGVVTAVTRGCSWTCVRAR